MVVTLKDKIKQLALRPAGKEEKNVMISSCDPGIEIPP